MRRCKAADLPAVLELWRTSGAAPSVTDNIVALHRRLKQNPQLFLLALDGSRIVGSVLGGWDGWRASMARLTVAPAYRRRGVALELVRRIETLLRRLGAKRISCIVLKENVNARAFWLSARYRLDSDAVRFVKDLR
jgi:ribosomal protein S18 acetylase RimI-like enzyme